MAVNLISISFLMFAISLKTLAKNEQGSSVKCAIILSEISEGVVKQREMSSREIGTKTYEGNWPPVIELSQGRPPGLLDVYQGEGAIIHGKDAITSRGFSICHAILIRDKRTGRSALLHYWGRFKPAQNTLLNDFPPEHSEVVMLGNKDSKYLDVSAIELNHMGYSDVKFHKMNDSGSWEFVYRPAENAIIYHNKERKTVVTVNSPFP